LSKHLIVSYLRQLISLAKTTLATPIHAHDSTSCGTWAFLCILHNQSVFAAYVFEINGRLVIIAQLKTSTGLIIPLFVALRLGVRDFSFLKATDSRIPRIARV
jgi:hypothetical protein